MSENESRIVELAYYVSCILKRFRWQFWRVCLWSHRWKVTKLDSGIWDLRNIVFMNKNIMSTWDLCPPLHYKPIFVLSYLIWLYDIFVCMWMHLLMCKHVKDRGWPQNVFSLSLSWIVFWDGISCLTWNSSYWLEWLSSELHRSTCLSVPRTGVKLHATIPGFSTTSKQRNPCLHTKHLTHGVNSQSAYFIMWKYLRLT